MTATLPLGATITVTVVRPATPDRFGDPTAPAAEFDLPGCVTSPEGTSSGKATSGSVENVVAADTVQSRLLLVAPPGADIRATDRVRTAGALWEVTGEPERYNSPFTGVGLTVTTLRKVTG